MATSSCVFINSVFDSNSARSGTPHYKALLAFLRLNLRWRREACGRSILRKGPQISGKTFEEKSARDSPLAHGRRDKLPICPGNPWIIVCLSVARFRNSTRPKRPACALGSSGLHWQEAGRPPPFRCKPAGCRRRGERQRMTLENELLRFQLLSVASYAARRRHPYEQQPLRPPQPTPQLSCNSFPISIKHIRQVRLPQNLGCTWGSCRGAQIYLAVSFSHLPQGAGDLCSSRTVSLSLATRID